MKRESSASNKSLEAYYITYYTRAVNMTVLAALSTIAIDQTKATKQTMDWCIQLLDYLASNQNAKVRFHASDMVMNIHLDTLYLSESGAQSCTCGNFSWDGCLKTENQ